MEIMERRTAVSAAYTKGQDGGYSITVISQGGDGNLKFRTGAANSEAGVLKALIALLPTNPRLVPVDHFGLDPSSVNGHGEPASNMFGPGFEAGERFTDQLKTGRNRSRWGYDQNTNNYVLKRNLPNGKLT